METIDSITTTYKTNKENLLLVATFFIGNARFGIDANLVQEVVQVRQTTVVHQAPEFITGVMNLRGRVVTIIDLGRKLTLGGIRRTDLNRILIVEWKQEYVGLLVDKVSDVVQVASDIIKKAPENVHGVQATLIAGIFQNENESLVALLDLSKVLDTGEEKQ